MRQRDQLLESLKKTVLSMAAFLASTKAERCSLNQTWVECNTLSPSDSFFFTDVQGLRLYHTDMWYQPSQFYLPLLNNHKSSHVIHAPYYYGCLRQGLLLTGVLTVSHRCCDSKQGAGLLTSSCCFVKIYLSDMTWHGMLLKRVITYVKSELMFEGLYCLVTVLILLQVPSPVWDVNRLVSR